MLKGDMRKMMRSETLRDRLLQVIGLIVLVVLTVALVFAFREHMLPQQEEGDVFGTVYAITSGDASSETAESGWESGTADLSSNEES